MADADLLELYERLYSAELEARTAIDSRISFSVGLAVVVAGIPVYLATNLPDKFSGVLCNLFWITWWLGIGLLAVALGYLAAAVWNPAYRRYKLLGPLDAIERYRRGFGDGQGSHFEDYLIRMFSEAAGRNQDLNVSRSNRWFTGTGVLLAAVVAFALSTGPFVWAKYSTQTAEEATMHSENESNMPALDSDQGSGGGTDGSGGRNINPVPEPPLRDTASENPPNRETRIIEIVPETKRP